MSDSLSLPTDLDLCHQMLGQLTETITQLQQHNERLTQRLDALLRRMYGRQSEKIDPNQGLLFDEVEQDSPEPPPEEADQSEPSDKRRQKRRHAHGRSPLPEHLPRRRVEHDLSEAEKLCSCCGEQRVRIGEQVCEQLDYEPASLHVVEHVRFSYACRGCQEQVQRADKPVQPIDKGLPGAGLLAQVIISKYVDHLPLYRQERIFERWQVPLCRSTLSDWMKACREILHPLVSLMRQRILCSRVIGTDETPVRVLDRGGALGRLWLYRGEEAYPYLVYDYTPTKSRDGPEAFLSGYRGYVQADASSSYDPVLAGHPITEVGCWAHVRRKFFDCRAQEPVRAHEALARIGQLYVIERDVADLSEGDRYAQRRARSVGLLESLHEWLLHQQKDALPKSGFGQAIGYALNQWEALQRYTEAGYLSMDNNAVERGLRRVALGRKNYLFVGNAGGGETAAVLYSVVGSAQRCGVEPFEYLRDVLSRIRSAPSEELDQLLPDQWKLRH